MYIEEQVGLERADGGKALLALVGPAGFDSLDNNPFFSTERIELRGLNFLICLSTKAVCLSTKATLNDYVQRSTLAMLHSIFLVNRKTYFVPNKTWCLHFPECI